MNDPYPTNLAEQISRGSHKAFDEVFRQYYGRVSNFIRSLIKSQSVAEDIAQDVFVNLWNSRHALSEVRSLNSYIYTIARNLCTDFCRARQTVPLEQAEQIPSEDRDEPQAVRIALEQALERLPEEERELIFLRYTNEMPVAEIAEILGISRFAVYRQERRALEHLRKQLNRRDFYG